jgi:hypothetical protein
MSYKTNDVPGFDWGLYRSIARKGGKLSHNTYVREDGDAIVVKFHATDIIRISPDGTVTLDTGGWRSVTTKQRMNAVLSNYRGRCSGCGGYDHKVTCGNCGREWCERCDPAPAALCPWCHGRGYSTHPLGACSHVSIHQSNYEWFANGEPYGNTTERVHVVEVPELALTEEVEV